MNLLDSMTGRYNRWQVWQDAIWCIAIAISNRVDTRYYDKREQMYLDIVKKYEAGEVENFSKMFALLVMEAEERTQKGNYGDFLGELFMALELGNNLGGQFFTPYCLCQMMAESTITKEQAQAKIDEQGYIPCADCAVGAGATLIAAAETFAKRGIDYPRYVMFAGQEIDSTTALMCYIQLSIIGCAGYVVIGDSLCNPMTGHVLFGEDSERCWFTPMFFDDVWHERRQFENTKWRVQKMMDALKAMGADLPPKRKTIATVTRDDGQITFRF